MGKMPAYAPSTWFENSEIRIWVSVSHPQLQGTIHPVSQMPCDFQRLCLARRFCDMSKKPLPPRMGCTKKGDMSRHYLLAEACHGSERLRHIQSGT